MTNEMKNVPGLRFPEFDGDWEEKKLKDISNKGMYGIGASATEFDGENVYVRITDINESSRKINNDKLTSPDKLDKKYLLNENDVLFARTGASTGKTYIHKNYDRDKNYYFAGFLIKFEFKNNYLANFIFQNTLTKRFENWVSVMSVRSGQPGINSEEYGKLKMMFPSKVEQNKIGAFFSKLDRQIELEEQKLAKLEEQKKGYMQKIFSQELRFKDKNGNDYPDWKSSKIENQLKERNERSGEEQMLSVTINSGIVKFNELDRKDNSSKDKSNYKVVKKDDIAYNSMRMWQGASGKSDYDGIVSPAYTVIYPTQSTNSAFIEYKFKTYSMIHTFKINSQGLTSDTWNLKYKQLKNINIDMPVLKEQEKIGSFFKKIDQLINKQKEKVEILQKNKNGFLQKMFV